MASNSISIPVERPILTLADRVAVYRWAIFGVLAAAQILVIFHRSSIAIMAPDLINTFQINASALGVLGSMYFYPYALMQLPVGILADVIGPRKLASFSFAIAGIGAFLFSLAPSFPVLVAARIMVGLGLSCIYVPTLKVISTWFRQEEFGTMTGILVSLGNVGGLIAATPLAILVIQHGWRLTIRSIGSITLLLSIFIYIIVRNSPRDLGFPAPVTKNRPMANVYGGQSMAASISQGIRAVATNRAFWPLALRGFAFYGVFMSFQGLWGGPYLLQVVGLNITQTGNLLMLIALGSMVAAPIGGYLSDRLFKSRRGPTIAATALSAVCWIPLALAPGRLSLPWLTVIFFSLGLAGGLGVTGIAQVKELFPASLSGTVSGVYNFCVMLGGAVFQIVLGLIIRSYALTPAGHYSSVAFGAGFQFLLVSLVVGTVALLFSREQKQAE